MSHVELFDLIARLKAAGITHFEQGDLKLSFSGCVQETPQRPRDLVSVPLEKQALAEPEAEPPHIIQQMKSLMKLSDEELLDQLFPVPRLLDEDMN